MTLRYPPSEAVARGKTSAKEDVVNVRFVTLEPARRIVEAVTFDTTDPNVLGEMTVEISFEAVPNGTRVTFQFKDLPPGVRPEDNDEGTRLSLAQLAARFE